MPLKTVPLEAVKLNPLLWVRAGGLNCAHAEVLADVLRAGGRLDPVEAWEVDGVLHLTDGFHTHDGHRLAGVPTIRVKVRVGTWSDAMAAAARSNQGPRALPLTNADKRRAVLMTLYAHPEWGAAKVARHAGVGDELARQMKAEHSGNGQHPAAGGSPSAECLIDDDDFRDAPPAQKTLGLDGRWRTPPRQAPKATANAATVTLASAAPFVNETSPAHTPAARFVVPHLTAAVAPDIEAAFDALAAAIDAEAARCRMTDMPGHERAVRQLGDLRALVLAWR